MVGFETPRVSAVVLQTRVLLHRPKRNQSQGRFWLCNLMRKRKRIRKTMCALYDRKLVNMLVLFLDLSEWLDHAWHLYILHLQPQPCHVSYHQGLQLGIEQRRNCITLHLHLHYLFSLICCVVLTFSSFLLGSSCACMHAYKPWKKISFPLLFSTWIGRIQIDIITA